MNSTVLHNKAIDNHFIFLKNLDIDSKKKLIKRLKDSIFNEAKTENLYGLFGSWKDSRTANEIIEDIQSFKINNRGIEDWTNQ